MKNIYKKVLAGVLSIMVIFAFSVVNVKNVLADEEHGNTGGNSELAQDLGSDFGLSHKPVCPGQESEDTVRCHSRIVVGANGAPKKGINGLTPAKFHIAYGSQTTTSTSKIIAISIAYDNPTILTDLNAYSQQFSIPTLPACVGPIGSSAVPCFKKTDQNGGTTFPQSNPNWNLEGSMDAEVAHAMCQNCSILFVEANDNGLDNMMMTIDQAVAQGANVVNASWGLSEFYTEANYNPHLNHPGVAIVFSSGDNGYGVQYPAASNFVTAVGGTTLNFSGNGSYVGETAWSGSGSGCSAYESKPAWQTDSQCSMRTVADVSAVANPATGAAIKSGNSWYTVGGTSLAAPIIVGAFALAPAIPSFTVAASLPYSNTNSANTHDIISGSNGSCGNSYLCTAITGFDGPTGFGTPKNSSLL